MNPGNETKPSWRDNWWVKKFTELAFIGSIIKYSKPSEAIYDAGKCAAMLGGGALAMMKYPPDPEHSEATRFAEMITLMAVGGFVGKTIYIETCNAATMLYQFTNERCKSEYCDPESQQLVNPSPTSSKISNKQMPNF